MERPQLDLSVPAAEGAGVSEAGERWRTAFAGACATHGIEAELTGPATRMAVRFFGQENADGPRIHHAFIDELRAQGIAVGSHLCPPAAVDEDTVRRVEAALVHAVGRLRTLLIEHNSYNSGGLPWCLGERAPTAVRGRGLAIYRFPAMAPVDVTAEPGAIRIAVAAGDLGEVTSSGFYVPTLLAGDIDVSIDYRLASWQPGPQAASFALFCQDEASVLRYYCQRRCAGDGPHEVLGNFTNTVFTTPQPVATAEGSFRIQRVGASVRILHRERDRDWQRLGSHDGDPTRPLITGAKIWSAGETGGLVAELTHLTIEADVPSEQIPEAAVRPDPRRS